MPFFPYRWRTSHKWFQWEIERDYDKDPYSNPLSKDIDMINMRNTYEDEVIEEAQDQIDSISLYHGKELYFHGTDSESAASILEDGIDLCKTDGNRDFSCGYGFYVTQDYEMAIEWANRRANKVPSETGAVVAFKISRRLQRSKPHLCLEVDTRRGRKLWEKVVSHFRHGGNDAKVERMLGDTKFIEGPVGKNAFLRPGERPTAHDFDQVCIIDEDYADRFGRLQNISFAMFFSCA